jgi:hypothetical protein
MFHIWPVFLCGAPNAIPALAKCVETENPQLAVD